ncbi:MAG: flippase-like domain-containing protein [Clostridia bacterium]|nr:flippase-like domain-containing protein [Clostridia bacterium]
MSKVSEKKLKNKETELEKENTNSVSFAEEKTETNLQNVVEKNSEINSDIKAIESSSKEEIKEEQKEENLEQIIDEQNLDELQVGETLIDSDVAKERLAEIEESKQPKKKKKSIIWNTIFFIINILFMVFVVRSLLKEAVGASLAEVISQQGSKLYYLLGALGCFILVYICSFLTLCVFVKNSTGKYHFKSCAEATIMGKYYDYITPMAVGGQPSQILTLIRGGVTPGVATSIPIIKMIVNQLVRVVSIIIIYIFLVPNIPMGSQFSNLLIVLCKILGVLGIIITAIVSLGSVFLGSSKMFGKTIAKWWIRFGYKLKIVKNYRKGYDKFMRQVMEYQGSLRYLAQNKGVMIKTVLLSLVEFIAFSSMSFFTSMAFATNPEVSVVGFIPGVVLWLVSMARYQVVDMASTIMILPGGTGLKEICFLIMFSYFFGNSNAVAWSFLSWRIFDYYLFLAIGFIYMIVRFIVKFSRHRRELKLEKNANLTQKS